MPGPATVTPPYGVTRKVTGRIRLRVMSNHISLLPAWDDAEGVRRASELFLATYGSRPDGVVVTNPVTQSARMAIVGATPMLQASADAGSRPVLTLFALPGSTNTLQSATDLNASLLWQMETQIVMTNLQRVVTPTSLPQSQQFFRVRQP